jgi:2-polyprenyl-6-methoxyphenol hydroxylase-like FAD-dependent oxidoreductase
LRRFKTPDSFWRRYELLSEFPEGLLPIGDAVAGFNPVFGQGMSVAAVDAEQLGILLESRVASGEGLDGLHEPFLAAVSEAVSEAWEGTAIFDLLYDSTDGPRPADYPLRRAMFMAMQELADEDEELRRMQLEVGNMLRPRASLFSADVVARLQERLADPAGS